MKNSDVWINGKKWRVDPRRAIGKGGEADVYDIGKGQALKVFKAPNHADFALDPCARQSAQERIAEHQKKLRQFPKTLPCKVIAPQDLATDATGQNIVGYTMPLLNNAEVLLRYGDRVFRENSGINGNQIVAIFRDLHATIESIHRKNVVIGDFNDLNVLVRLGETNAFVIDADSFQFAPFYCRVFTARFVDPLLIDEDTQTIQPNQPHNAASDWYAFCVMLMQSLLYVDPYGGLYKPKDATQKVAHHLRPLQRITVFHNDVCYPKPALPFDVLPDEVLQFLEQIFVKDKRAVFPLPLLDNLRWTKCNSCGQEHARPLCPFCYVAPAIKKQSITVRGTVTATRIFQTEGIILCAAYDDKLCYLVHENGRFQREDGHVILQGSLDAQTRFRLQGKATLIGRHDQLIVLSDGAATYISADRFGQQTSFCSNGTQIYWAQNGQLFHDAQQGPQYIGEVLANQTLFWCGNKFGFGFYRAGNMNVAFVFDIKKPGINDNVQMPLISGQLLDATCVFSDECAWLFTATQEKSQLINRCFVFRANGELLANATALQGDGSWLGGSIWGRCANGHFLLASTDEGIVRVEMNGTRLCVTKTFPDTEPFANATSRLFAGPDGLYVAGPRNIFCLKIR